MRKIRGAFWPDQRRAAAADLQRGLGCESLIASFFLPEFLVTEPIEGQLYIIEATHDQWKDIAEDWELENKRQTSLHLH